LLIPKGVRGILNYKEVTMTIENRSPEPIETVSEDYRHELDKVAKTHLTNKGEKCLSLTQQHKRRKTKLTIRK